MPATPPPPVRVVCDCSAQDLAATVPAILAQAADAALAGDVIATTDLLALAQERMEAAEGEPSAVTIRPYTDDELEQHAIDVAAGDQFAAAAVDASWASLRARRDTWLLQTDWMFLDQLPADTPAATLKKAIEANKAAWTTFRQALRDLPSTTTDPAAVDWPTPPDAPAVSLS